MVDRQHPSLSLVRQCALLALAVTGGVALAWGGPGHGWGWGRGDHDERKGAVAAKVAEILGTDEQETADAIAQASQEVRQEAQQAALNDFAGRVVETLDTDAEATADAIEQVAGEMRSEALEEKLQEALDKGRITEEQAQEYRDKAESAGWHGFGFKFKGDSAEEFANRVGAIPLPDWPEGDALDVADELPTSASRAGVCGAAGPGDDGGGRHGRNAAPGDGGRHRPVHRRRAQHDRQRFRADRRLGPLRHGRRRDDRPGPRRGARLHRR